jgi:hypothetical protein
MIFFFKILVILLCDLLKSAAEDGDYFILIDQFLSSTSVKKVSKSELPSSTYSFDLFPRTPPALLVISSDRSLIVSASRQRFSLIDIVPLKVQGNSLRFDDRVSRHRLRRRLV